VAQVVLASSLHALGGPGRAFDPQGGFPLSAYGLSKRFAEQAGLLFHQRHGMRVIALRIGWCSENPASLRDLLRLGYLDAYLSMRDACAGCEAALSARDVGFAIWHAHGGLDKLPFPVDNDRWRAKDHWPEGLPNGVLDAISVTDAIPTR